MSLLAGLSKRFRFLATWLLLRKNFHAFCLYTREGTELNFENNYHSIKEWHQIKKLAQTSFVPDSGSNSIKQRAPLFWAKFNNENYRFVTDLTAEFILYTFIEWKESFHRKNAFPIDWRASGWLCWCCLNWLFYLRKYIFRDIRLFIRHCFGRVVDWLAYLEWKERKQQN